MSRPKLLTFLTGSKVRKPFRIQTEAGSQEGGGSHSRGLEGRGGTWVGVAAAPLASGSSSGVQTPLQARRTPELLHRSRWPAAGGLKPWTLRGREEKETPSPPGPRLPLPLIDNSPWDPRDTPGASQGEAEGGQCPLTPHPTQRPGWVSSWLRLCGKTAAGLATSPPPGHFHQEDPSVLR